MPTERQLPQYQCHKKVWALKIKKVLPHPTSGAIIEPADDGYAEFAVEQAYIDKHQPQAGGYYIVYEDGYKSYSPPEPFEAGYTLID